ncbi:Ig-like domain-containing protein [Puniceicoccaceae bacterium K14]|nr:Ig-like domain-containing protein [Puniceicoccaceae bacterium K14]
MKCIRFFYILVLSLLTLQANEQVLEDFSSDADRFTKVSGNWRLSDGHYEPLGLNFRQIRNQDVFYWFMRSISVHEERFEEDYRAGAKVRLGEHRRRWCDAALLFGYQDSSNFYYISISNLRWPFANGVFRVVDGRRTRIMGFGGKRFYAGSDYLIEIDRIGDEISVFLDGEEFGSIVDTTFVGGQLGFGANSRFADFDDLFADGFRETYTLIADDFSADASQFVELLGGDWAWSDGRYELSNPGNSTVAGLLGNLSIHKSVFSGDYLASAVLRITGTASNWNDNAFVFDFIDLQNFSYVSLNESDDSNTKGIFQVVNGVPSELYDLGSLSIVSDQDYVVEVERLGATVIVRLDGVEVAVIADSTPSGGQVGFGSKNDGGQFDDLLVSMTGQSQNPVTGVNLSPDAIQILVNESADLTAVLTPSEASFQSLTWSSSDANVATVNADGVVVAVGEGQSIITVSTVDGGYSDTSEVLVVVLVDRVSLSPEVLNLTVGETASLSETVFPSNATNKSVTWSSSDSAVASVDQNGFVTGAVVGSAMISVTTQDGGFSDASVVNVMIRVSGVSVLPSDLSLSVGESGSLSAEVTPVDATDTSVTWSTSDSEVATVDETGQVTAVNEGSATITATTNEGGFRDTSAVSVANVDREAPGVPSAVSVESVTATSVELSWNASADNIGVVGYTVYTDGGSPVNVVGTKITTVGLSPNNNYSFTVSAYDAHGNESAPSDSVAVTTTSSGQSISTEIVASGDDREIHSDGSAKWSGQGTIRVGGSSANVEGNAIFPFALPVLDADETIVGASFAAFLETKNNTPLVGPVDLYGLDYRTSSTVVSSSDFYTGPFGGDSAATAIDDAIATSSTPNATFTSTDSAGESKLLDYIRAQYSLGASGGDYVFLRLNSAHTDEFDYRFWTFGSADNSVVANQPRLTLLIGQSGIADTEAPSAPDGVFATEVASTSVDLSWNPATDNLEVVGYKIYTDGAAPLVVAGSSVTIAGLSPNVGYSFAVSAYDAAGNESSMSEEIEVTTASGSDGNVYYVDPVTGSMGGQGTASEPWSTLAEVFAAGKVFESGDTLYLRTGDHGFPVISGSNTRRVTIMAEPGHRPVLNRIDFNGASGWALKGVDIHTSVLPPWTAVLEHPVYPQWGNSLVLVANGSSNILFQDCDIYSIDDSSAWTADNWNYEAWNGFYIRQGSHYITIEDCQVRNVNFGIHMTDDTHNLTLRGNTVQRFCGDGLRARGKDLLIENNYIADAYQTNGNHSDLLQGFASQNVILRGNTFMNASEVGNPFLANSQGIACFGGWYDNWVIENNIVAVTHWHGITLYGARDSRIINNTVVLNPNGIGNGTPWISVEPLSGQASSGNYSHNNLTVEINGSSGTVLSNNIETTDYAAHFVDHANYDFRLLSTSSAVDAGTIDYAPTYDFEGDPRDGSPDVGADEFLAAVGQVATPTFSLPSGSYATAQSVSISSSTADATIRYTLDGTMPSRFLGQFYSDPIALDSAVELKAIAFKNGMEDSDVVSATYEIAGGDPELGTVWGATDEITSNGITWTFDREVVYGTFITGDFWIVGPANVIDISNSLNSSSYTPRVGQNGSMLNPLLGHDRQEQGYDDGLNSYNASLNVGRPNGQALSVSNPLSLAPHDSLVSQVSWLYNSSSDAESGCPSFNNATGTPRPATRSAGILTVLEQTPPDNSFRSPYVGNDNSVKYGIEDLDTDLLLELDVPSLNLPDISTLEDQMRRPWIDHVFEFLGAFVHPSEHMPNYGRDMGHIMLQSALAVHLDFEQLPGNPDKEQLLINLVQYGIDSTGIADNGGGWRANGGHGLGRKWPILFAGLMLDDAHMQSVGLWGQHDGTSSGVGTEFQEFQNCFYVSQTEVDLTNSAAWNPDSRDLADGKATAYAASDVGIPEWGLRHTYRPTQDNAHLEAKYRDINTGVHVGSALAVRLMDAETLWNHDAFIDYCDRIMALTDGGTGSNALPDFAKEMWTHYRNHDSSGPSAPSFITEPSIEEVDALGGSYTYSLAYGATEGNPVPVLAGVLSLDGVDVTSEINSDGYTVTAGVSPQVLLWEVTASNGVNPDATASVSVIVPSQTSGAAVSEDFSSDASNFEVVAGQVWSVEDGRYQLMHDGATNAGAGQLGYLSLHRTAFNGDYTASAIVNIFGTASVWNDAAFVFNYQDASNFYYVSLNESDDPDTLGIIKVEDGAHSQIYDLPDLSIASDVDYLVTVERSGASIIVSLNGAEVASLSDTAFSGGRVGFGSRNDSAQFDDLLVFGETIMDTTPPSVPEGLSSSNITNTSVDLSWSESTEDSGIVAYYVYTDGSDSISVDGTSVTVNGLNSGTTYSFTVTAYDPAGNESDQSVAIAVTTSGSGVSGLDAALLGAEEFVGMDVQNGERVTIFDAGFARGFNSAPIVWRGVCTDGGSQTVGGIVQVLAWDGNAYVWEDVGTVASDGAWSGTVNHVAKAGIEAPQLRFKDGIGTSALTNTFGVGIISYQHGQSNKYHWSYQGDLGSFPKPAVENEECVWVAFFAADFNDTSPQLAGHGRVYKVDNGALGYNDPNNSSAFLSTWPSAWRLIANTVNRNFGGVPTLVIPMEVSGEGLDALISESSAYFPSDKAGHLALAITDADRGQSIGVASLQFSSGTSSSYANDNLLGAALTGLLADGSTVAKPAAVAGRFGNSKTVAWSLDEIVDYSRAAVVLQESPWSFSSKVSDYLAAVSDIKSNGSYSQSPFNEGPIHMSPYDIGHVKGENDGVSDTSHPARDTLYGGPVAGLIHMNSALLASGHYPVADHRPDIVEKHPNGETSKLRIGWSGGWLTTPHLAMGRARLAGKPDVRGFRLNGVLVDAWIEDDDGNLATRGWCVIDKGSPITDTDIQSIDFGIEYQSSSGTADTASGWSKGHYLAVGFGNDGFATCRQEPRYSDLFSNFSDYAPDPQLLEANRTFVFPAIASSDSETNLKENLAALEFSTAIGGPANPAYTVGIDPLPSGCTLNGSIVTVGAGAVLDNWLLEGYAVRMVGDGATLRNVRFDESSILSGAHYHIFVDANADNCIIEDFDIVGRGNYDGAGAAVQVGLSGEGASFSSQSGLIVRRGRIRELSQDAFRLHGQFEVEFIDIGDFQNFLDGTTDYSASTIYSPGDQVLYGDFLYTAIASVQGDAPSGSKSDNTWWENQDPHCDVFNVRSVSAPSSIRWTRLDVEGANAVGINGTVWLAPNTGKDWPMDGGLVLEGLYITEKHPRHSANQIRGKNSGQVFDNIEFRHCWVAPSPNNGNYWDSLEGVSVWESMYDLFTESAIAGPVGADTTPSMEPSPLFP